MDMKGVMLSQIVIEIQVYININDYVTPCRETKLWISHATGSNG